MLKKNGWSNRPSESLLYKENTLVVKPQWEIDGKEKGADVLRSKLSKVFSDGNGMKQWLEHAVMINLCYFNTQTESILRNTLSSEIQDYCRAKTLEFIEILNPKNILLLSSSRTTLSKLKVSGLQSVTQFITKGRLGSRAIYSIPHYASRMALTHGLTDLRWEKP